MSEHVLPLDIETRAIDALAARADVATRAGGADNVSGRLRRGWQADDPALRITRAGGTPVDHVGVLDRARLQVEAFAADDVAAHDLAAHALLGLRELEGTKLVDAFVTAVEQDLGMRLAPDPITNASRYVFGVVLYARRLPS